MVSVAHTLTKEDLKILAFRTYNYWPDVSRNVPDTAVQGEGKDKEQTGQTDRQTRHTPLLQSVC